MARALEKFSVVLGRFLKTHGMTSRLHEYRVASSWRSIAGPVLALHAEPRDLRGKRLHLVVDSPAWMHQLSLMKPELISRINQRLGADLVKEISLKLGEIESKPEHAKVEPHEHAELTSEDRERVDRSIRDIQDEEMREAFRRLFEKDLLYKKR
jgi:predicted nucleic acid-binding Zn ribbon protein